jgi:hypothetical protein
MSVELRMCFADIACVYRYRENESSHDTFKQITRVLVDAARRLLGFT